ncbi:MAG: hypothetical protein ACE5LX_07140 [Nitrospinota bacterium]
MPKRLWRFAIFALVLLILLAGANLPAGAGPGDLGVGLRFSSWLDLRALEAFASLRIRDNFSLELGTWVLPIPPALSLLIVDAKIYSGGFSLGAIKLKPFWGGGGAIANYLPYALVLLDLRVFGGVESSIANLSLFIAGGLGYMPIPLSDGLPFLAITAGAKFDL